MKQYPGRWEGRKGPPPSPPCAGGYCYCLAQPFHLPTAPPLPPCAQEVERKMEAQAEAKRKAQLAQVQCEVWSVELLICSVQNRLVSTVSNQEPFPLSLPTAPLPHPPLPCPDG